MRDIGGEVACYKKEVSIMSIKAYVLKVENLSDQSVKISLHLPKEFFTQATEAELFDSVKPEDTI